MRHFSYILPAIFMALPAWAVEKMAPAEANEALAAGKIVLVDIRTPAEWAETGVAKGAVPLDMTSASFQTDFATLFAANPGKKIALICRSGNRSGQLSAIMESSGLTNIIDVTGGTNEWLAAGLPVDKK